MKYTISDSEFVSVVANSTSLARVIEASGLVVAGGNYLTTKNRIKRLNLNTDHFKGQSHATGKKRKPRREIHEFLSGSPISSFKLKNRLLQENILERVCVKCNGRVWQEGLIPLELHHIDGNPLNNSLDNLQLLCPNCHAQTETYRGKNKKG